jgi:peroxiredoxin Q/BCP
MTLPKLGAKAPAFTLQDQTGAKVSLEDFAGRPVVLYFYPKAMTPGCTVQACGVRDAKVQFAKLGAVVLGVSPDAPARLAKFVEKESLNFTLLGDEDHAIAEKYGVWQEKQMAGRKYMGIVRTTFLIDRDGKIASLMEKVNTKTHADDVVAWLKEHA